MGDKKTAMLIREIPGWRGEARLYNLVPPIEGYDGETHDYVIVSAVNGFVGSETYIFPATAEGEAIDFLELEGSFRGGLSHEDALIGAGYEIADVLVVQESQTRKAIGS